MATKITTCPIWGTEYEAEGYFDEATRTFHVESSPRAGGGYLISQVELDAILKNYDASGKARLTTWLIDQQLQGNKRPVITKDVVKYVNNKRSLSIQERADRLLKFLGNSSTTVAQRVIVQSDEPRVFSWSESVQWVDVTYLIGYLLEEGYLSGRRLTGGGFMGQVTVKGYDRIAEDSADMQPAQALIATLSSDEYTRRQSKRMEDALASDDLELAIGTAKELIETCCKTILEKRGVQISSNPEFSDLTKEVFKELKLTNHDISSDLVGVDLIRRMQSNLASLCNDIGRLRNLYGTGHGKTADSPSLSKRHARLIVSSAAALTVYLFETESEPTPLLKTGTRKPLGQWLVDNMPRGTNLEPPSRDDFGRPNPFLEDDVR